MEEISAAFFFVAFPILMLLIFAYLIITWRVERRLESKHSAVWSGLGEPNLITNNSINNNAMFIKYIKHREFEMLNDELLSRMAKLSRRLYLSIMCGFLALAVVMVMGFVLPVVI